MRLRIPKLTFWRVVATAIIATGLVAAVLRYSLGLGPTTNLSDDFPWGMWVGFDLLCGVGLAAGGFTIAAIVHVFHIRRFEPIVRPSILTAYLGYLLVIVALLVDLGRPWAIWHAIVMWNPNSVMFEVAWCVMLYTTVLTLEFAPVVFEKLGWAWPLKMLRGAMTPIIILGILLSTLHQSSLGSMYLIVPEKLYPLWYSPYLPAFFYVSAIGVGLAMTIFESFLSSRAFRRGLEMHLLNDIGRICVVFLALYGTMKLLDLAYRDLWGLLLVPRAETWFWWAEVAIGILVPLVLLIQPRVRAKPAGLFTGAVCVVLGFVINRLNVSITGLEAYAGRTYFPSWIEIAVTLAVVATGFVIFALAARYLPVFEHGPRDAETVGEETERRWVEQLRLASRAH
uniref:Ni/Fe-hydrogenase cytochrome b subunit n=1 Tax=Eiseniibacteriota bacterium TaxID=2212470 RepID=A0A832MLN5_UNCEI